MIKIVGVLFFVATSAVSHSQTLEQAAAQAAETRLTPAPAPRQINFYGTFCGKINGILQDNAIHSCECWEIKPAGAGALTVRYQDPGDRKDLLLFEKFTSASTFDISDGQASPDNVRGHSQCSRTGDDAIRCVSTDVSDLFVYKTGRIDETVSDNVFHVLIDVEYKWGWKISYDGDLFRTAVLKRPDSLSAPENCD